jgi:carbonic anhydrase
MVAEDEREFDYGEKSEKGPARWGELRPEWSECGHGTMQSPIDLSNERVEVVSHLGRLKKNYKPSYATLKNRGHDMMVSKTRTKPKYNYQKSMKRNVNPPTRRQILRAIYLSTSNNS